jgi:uncharacterized protein (DUF1501 family)
MLTRRDFLSRSTLLALAPAVPGFLAQTARATKPERDGRILVVVQLDGGNDGINTVVPFKDEGYAKHRKTLRLPAGNLIKVKDGVGLHPAMAEVGKLLEKGSLTVVQGVGYPNPSRSHFESMAVWQTARRSPREHAPPGWLGRAFDPGKGAPRGEPASVYVGGGELPVALRGRRCIASALTRPEDFVLDPDADTRRLLGGAPAADDLTAFVRRHALDAYATADRMGALLKSGDDGASYPDSELARRLRMVARLIKAGTGTRVFYARQGGYDTHAGQFGTHYQLLSELSGALGAFLKDLTGSKLAERVAVLCFSEFGRTVKENGSAGTDHGTAAPVFLAGPGVKGGLVGATPSLTDLDPRHGDLKVQTDFRRVYAGVLEDWLGLASKDALGGSYERVELFRRR